MCEKDADCGMTLGVALFTGLTERKRLSLVGGRGKVGNSTVKSPPLSFPGPFSSPSQRGMRKGRWGGREKVP